VAVCATEVRGEHSSGGDPVVTAKKAAGPRIPKHLHLYWGLDRPLSWLRWLTVRSFALQNPGWKITVWRPPTQGLKPQWSTGEHRFAVWEGEDWGERLLEAGQNVLVREADLQDFPPMTEVNRSDLFRWRLLAREGGWWSDFDIFYFRPMGTLLSELDPNANVLLCPGEIERLRDWQSIGFLAAIPGSDLFRTMETDGLQIANTVRARRLGYQQLGEQLLKSCLPGVEQRRRDTIGRIPQWGVYPFNDVKNQQRALWSGSHPLEIRKSSVGIHWFGGQRMSAGAESRLTGPDTLFKYKSGGLVDVALKSGLFERTEVDHIQEGLKYSFVMPYMDRPGLLHNTLTSYSELYGNRPDWEVVIVEDAKNDGNPAFRKSLQDVIWRWTERGVNIRSVGPVGELHQFNPSAHFNLGVSCAKGDYIILTSPEIFHVVDVLFILDEEFFMNPDSYVVCSCKERIRCKEFIQTYQDLKGKQTVWYQHSSIRSVLYHFCSAISRHSYLRVGGFDEQYMDGYCFDDDDWVETLRKNGIPFVERDDALTWHMAHPPVTPGGRTRGWKRNKRIFEEKWRKTYSPSPPVARR